MSYKEQPTVPVSFRGVVIFLPKDFSYKVGLSTKNTFFMTAFDEFIEDMRFLELLKEKFPSFISDTNLRIIISDSISNDIEIENGILDYLTDSSIDEGKHIPIIKRMIGAVGTWVFRNEELAIQLLDNIP